MATTDWDYIATRNEIIQRALRLIGAYTLGETVSADQYLQSTQALQEMVKSWQNKRIFLWTLRDLTLTLAATTASYAVSTDPAIIGIDRAAFLSGSTEIPLDIISWREYRDIETKTDPGQPLVIALDNRATPTAYVYPVPTAIGTIRYLGIAKTMDWESASGSADFPVRWQNALTYGLAADLADEYGLPLTERNYLRDRAGMFFAEASKSDRERSDYEFVNGAYPVRN